MKKIFLLLNLFGLFYSNSKAQGFAWTNSIGSLHKDIGTSVVIDASGNVFTTGTYNDTCDFDTGPGTFLLAAIGNDNIFLSKCNSSGNLVWVKGITTGLGARPNCVSVDKIGNIYITGQFFGSGDFDPGPNVCNLVSSGNVDIFVAKFSSNGDLLWAKSIGASGHDAGLSIVVDSSANIYSTGTFEHIVDFDPGPGVINLTGNSSQNIFVNKLDSNGNFLWAKSMDGLQDDYGTSICLNSTCDVLIAGTYINQVDFDPGPTVFNLPWTGNQQFSFVCKFTSNGDFIWAKKIGATKLTSMEIDRWDNILTTGGYRNSSDFDPGPAVHNLSTVGDTTIFVCKWDSAGNFLWVRAMGSTMFDDVGYDIITDNKGNVYTTGTFRGTADFDPGAGVFTLSSYMNDVFVSKLDSNGLFRWAKAFGSTGEDFGYGVSNDGNKSVCVTGCYIGTVDFDPSAAIINYTSYGMSDIFTSKFDSCSVNGSAANISACNKYILDGQTYNTSGAYAQTLISVSGCDSIFSFNLTIKDSSSSSVIVPPQCSPFTYNGVTYYYTGTYTQLFTNAVGCDSILFLNLVINATYTLLNASACYSYTLNGQTYDSTGTYTQTFMNAVGCDSLVFLDLVIHDSSINVMNQVACDTFALNGQTYTSSGTYFQTFTNALGCDSIVTLNLIIHNSTSTIINHTACNSYTFNGQTYTQSGGYVQMYNTVVGGCDSLITLFLTINILDSTVTQMGPVLSANAVVATFQWISCNPFQILNGETNKVFTATMNGDYACIITQNGCTDTSSCYTVNGLGLDNFYTDYQISISPNPSPGKFMIESTSPLTKVELKITDHLGQTVYQLSNLSGKLFDFNISAYPAGIYFVKLQDGNRIRNFKIVKQ